MSKIYLTSDWHFMHNRDFIYKPRGFTNTLEMSQEIVKRYNEIIQPEDHVYVLGDLMLNDDETGIKLIKSLKGTIHIIRGNHDTDTRMEFYKNCYNIAEVCEGKFLNYNGYHFYLTHFPCICSNFDYEKPLKSRTINLCGHTHTPDKFLDWDKGVIYHVEVDAHNCYPVFLDDILNEIKTKFSA